VIVTTATPWWRHPRLILLAAPLLVCAPLAGAQEWSAEARALLLAGTALACWLTEWTPPWLPTLVLWLGVPALLGPLSPAFAPAAVLGWSADPVLVLFAGGFALAAAATAQGLDRVIARALLRRARGDAWRVVVAAAVATWLLSMWMSNVAAAALMLGALAPVLASPRCEEATRRALLVAIAMGANTGGIATPIGTGPNAIAIAQAGRWHAITFVEWMGYGVPLAAGLLAAALLLTRLRLRPHGTLVLDDAGDAARDAAMPRERRRAPARVAIVGALTIAAWLTEPLHGVAAWRVAALVVPLLLVVRALPSRALLRLDWSTLTLIAGGLALGGLLEASGLAARIGAMLAAPTLPETTRLALVCVAAALGSAVMSNTGTATLLIPLALQLAPGAATAILVANACSLGIPFTISTPPNAMVAARGLPARDLLAVGAPLMLAGLVLLVVTGPSVLRALR
jgi:sodium-dependent dicarboxylate transporter 2/3/5